MPSRTVFMASCGAVTLVRHPADRSSRDSWLDRAPRWLANARGRLLTRYMPSPLKRIVLPARSPHPNSFFARHIYPVLDTKCVACHGTNKEQAGSFDSYESLMVGGKDGIVIAPRNPERSLLLQKVTLPPVDPHFMPAEGRTPLTPEEIARIRAWVVRELLLTRRACRCFHRRGSGASTTASWR